GLHPDSYHLIQTPLVDGISDKRISERLGVFTDYTFVVVGATLNPGSSRVAEVSRLESNYDTHQGKTTVSRRYKWLSWPQIGEDHPLVYRAGNILSSIEPHLARLPISSIQLTDGPAHARESNRAAPKKYTAVIMDAGGVLFKEEFWLGKLRRYYHHFVSAVSPHALELSFSHYTAISRALTLLTQAAPKTDLLALVRDFHGAYGAEGSQASHSPRGILLPGVLPVLQALREKEIPVYVLTSATMSGREFMSKYATVLSDARGNLLVSGCFTSRDMGATKLCPHLYNSALAQWGLEQRRKNTLMIAHDIHEILGARYAGGLSVAAVNVHYTETKIAKRFANVLLDRLEGVLDVV
ncbi:MAG TPA: hypothetical protein VFW33_02030, partial [Gemmataceae bacterium]|nr:hypothetical protein [Gemmataceae bacterium]